MLLWLSDQIDQGKIPVAWAANHSGGTAAATDWIRNYGFVIPAQIAPVDGELEEYAAFFSTFLTASFDVVKKPGKRGAGPALGCACPLCVRIINAPHLQAKKLNAGDKQRANLLMAESLKSLASSNGLELSDSVADNIVLHEQYRRDCAFLCYGEWLIRRLAGESDGPAILALWRLIAWDRRGGQIRGFKLQIEDFTRAERRLLDLLRELTS